MRWTARILGLVYSICLARDIVVFFLGVKWHHVPTLFTGLMFPHFFLGWLALPIALAPPIMLGVAWKRPGRWPELAAGGIFMAWGFVLLAGMWILVTPPNFLTVPLTSIGVCLPFAIGILFILGYKKSKYAKP